MTALESGNESIAPNRVSLVLVHWARVHAHVVACARIRSAAFSDFFGNRSCGKQASLIQREAQSTLQLLYKSTPACR